MTTTNYAWSLPIVGGNQNQWGTMLNTILTDIDAKMVSKTDAQTLTNKTLAAPVITGGASISGNVAVAGQLTTTDNVGICVTPSAWAAGHSVAEFGTVANSVTALSGGDFNLVNNAFLGGSGWVYKLSGGAARFQQDFGVSRWLIDSGTKTAGAACNFVTAMALDASGNLLPGGNGTQAFGSTSLRWSQVWCTAGAFNTSDATLKTKVSKFNDAEIQAAIALSKEIGWFQWLDAVKEKGEEKARHHVGLTVQRAAEVLKSFGLDPWIFGFMSHDVWDDQITEHPAIEAVEAVLDEDGNEVTPAIEANDAWSEVTLKAGESYAFRYDQLNLFIARGIEARLTALEARA